MTKSPNVTSERRFVGYSEHEKSGKDSDKWTKENWASDRTLKQKPNGKWRCGGREVLNAIVV